ncbi:MAG: ABC transporter ATP-binding protein [Campylobacterota bacterium]|nr:ABC transporter ATP-binding protein [Campylobacterota bacterium]
MDKTNVIEVNNISKIFSKNHKSARHQLKKVLFENYFGCKEKNVLDEGEFLALKNVSFSVRKNEKLAILGPNGSGKSTLLKMLNGIYMPDEGEIRVNGLLSSILELSTGFNPELSGRDNIYLKFSLQGKVEEEVNNIIDDVIAFSELEEFMDTPLAHYSSGMKSKLGFSIVSSMNPEILILDEVFAAGDKKFREKSEKRIKELYQNTTTILVTHSMEIVKDIADRVIVLKKGELVFDGEPDDGIKFYNEMME